MEVIKHKLEGVIEIIPDVFKDERGYFTETFHNDRYGEFGIKDSFVQDNESMSSTDVIRGLHFQHPPFAQSKLVRVIKGSVLDVVVDIRKDSPTYLEHLKVVLSSSKKNQLYVPIGFAHGFATLEDQTIFTYKCGNYYHKKSEDGILYNDSNLKIDWEIANPIVSEKDTHLTKIEDFISPF